MYADSENLCFTPEATFFHCCCIIAFTVLRVYYIRLGKLSSLLDTFDNFGKRRVVTFQLFLTPSLGTRHGNSQGTFCLQSICDAMRKFEVLVIWSHLTLHTEKVFILVAPINDNNYYSGICHSWN